MTIRNMIEQLDNQLKMKAEDSPYYGPIESVPRSDRRGRPGAAGGGLSRGDHRRNLSRADAAARLSEDRLSRERARRLRAHVHEGRRASVPLPGAVDDDAADDAGGDPQPRPQRSRADHRRDGKGSAGGRLQGQSRAHSSSICGPSKQFQAKSRDALTQAYYDVGRRGRRRRFREYFSTLPKTALVIRPYPPFREKFEAGGSYEQGTPDG